MLPDNSAIGTMHWPRLCRTDGEQSLPGASGGATTPRRAQARGGWGDAAPLRARYAFGAVLARGVSAEVVAATRHADGTQVAIKVLSRPSRSRRRRGAELRRAESAALAAPGSGGERRKPPPPFRDAVKRELLLQRALPFHKHIVPCHEVVLANKISYVVMERARGGTLLDVVTRGAPGDAIAKRAAGQILDALGFLHARGIIHRDIKLENVLVRDDATAEDAPLHVLLCDFGSARFSASSQAGGTATAHVGTLPYMAPEQLRGGTCDPAVDVWSFGIVLCALCVGSHPLARVPREAWAGAMARDDLPGDAAAWPSPGAFALARACLRLAPCDRISAVAARAHAWFAAPDALTVATPPPVVRERLRSARELRDDEP